MDIYNYHSETDMAVVVSSSQNDVAIVKAKGGDIKPHRKRMLKEDLEKKFIKEAESVGLDGWKGHRSVGGMRASIYNAFPERGVDALVDFMKEFERKQG